MKRILPLLALVGCSGPVDDPPADIYEGQTVGDCEDGADNDADGSFDCDDAGCAAAPSCDEAGETPDDDTDGEGGETDVDPAVLEPSASAGDDFDGDGWGAGWGDCDDFDRLTNPAAAEIGGNGTDDDCDGIVDEETGSGGACNPILLSYAAEGPADYFRSPVGLEFEADHCLPGWWVCTEFLDSSSCVAGCVGGSSTHIGEDWNFGSGSDDVGQQVVSVGEGVVVLRHSSPSWVNLLVVRHDAPAGGYFTFRDGGREVQTSSVWSLYGHIEFGAGTSVGSAVSEGQVLGTISPTLCTLCTGPHLHFEIVADCDASVPGPGYQAGGAGRVDPSEFLDSVEIVYPDLPPGNTPPTTPSVNAPSRTTEGVATTVSVTVGTDADGDDVKVQCTSADSNWSASPYDSGLGLGGRVVSPSFTWNGVPPGQQRTIFCTSFDRPGDASGQGTDAITVDPSCTPRDHQDCSGGDVWWYDSCGTPEPGPADDCHSVNETCTDAGALATCDWDVTVREHTDSGDWCQGGARDIFRARSVATITGTTSDPQIQVTFEKCGGGAVIADKSCHILVGSWGGPMLDPSIVRRDFTWNAGLTSKQVTWDMYPSGADYLSAPLGDEKIFHLVCDEPGGDWNHWRTENPLRFEKER